MANIPVSAPTSDPGRERPDPPALYTSPPSPNDSQAASSAVAMRSSSTTNARPTSPLVHQRGRTRYRSVSRPPGKTGTMDLKQLTCYYWRIAGQCRHSSKDCMYSHYDTGRYAEAPRSVVPGRPPVAGRNADRRMREVENHLTGLRLDSARMMHSRSTSSLANLINIDNQSFSAPPGGAFNISRPSTPAGLLLRSPAAPTYQAQSGFSFVPNSPLHYATTNAAQVESEVKFFRTLVEQGGKEKEVMVSTIESLQAENQGLRAESESNKAENKRLTEERDALYGALNLLQQQQQQQQRGGAATATSRSTTPGPSSTLRRFTPGSSSFADFGAIGARRFGSGNHANGA